MSNATAIAAEAAALQSQEASDIRQLSNQNAAGWFTIGVAGLIVLSIIFFRIDVLLRKSQLGTGSPAALNGLVTISRPARSFTIRKVPGFTSGGHALIFSGWTAICISVLFTKLHGFNLDHVPPRLGWLAVCNFSLAVFLSLKKTPLAYLTANSYDRINLLHKLVGYGMVFFGVLHGLLSIITLAKADSLETLVLNTTIYGITAGLSLLIILTTSLFLRKLKYEVWYIMHIAFVMLIMIMVGLHRPDFATRTVIIIVFTATIWVIDKTLRLSTISFFSFGNVATISPLPLGGTRVVMRKSPSRAVAGAHALLWIPAIRATETHPFTIVSTNPLEFVVAAQGGFTRDLHAYALKYPGKTIKASIDGPYGVVPSYTDFDRALFIAGGVGASYTFGLAIDLLRKMRGSTGTTIEFVWVVKHERILAWFAKELEELQASPFVKLSIYSTQSSADSIDTSATSLEKKLPTEVPISDDGSGDTSSITTDVDVEKRLPLEKERSFSTLPITDGRPDVVSIIKSVVSMANKKDRISVAACGPGGMMQATRNAVADSIRGGGPSIELFSEELSM